LADLNIYLIRSELNKFNKNFTGDFGIPEISGVIDGEENIVILIKNYVVN